MKRWLVLIVTICLVGAVLTGCSESEAAAQETAVVDRGDLVVSVAVSGNLEMPRKTDLSFGATGVVAEVLVDEGDNVVKGQVLARLDARALELAVEAAQIEREMAEINLMQTIYPHYTKTWGTDMPGVWLALDEAQDNLIEAQELLNEGKIEEAHVLLAMVEENIIQAEEKSLAAQWKLPWSVRLLELQVDVAKAALDVAKLNLAEATIVAPFDAVVADIAITEGKELSAMSYAEPAITLIDPSDIKMSGVIDEIDIGYVRIGQEAIVILDALPDKEVKGRVTFVSPASTIKTGVVSYKTTITLENPDEELRDGMSATADIIVERYEDVLLIPNRAIQGSLAKPWVEVVTGGGEIEQREVVLGISNGINTEVLSGLEEGEIVVLPRVNQFSFMPFGG